jgi:poly(beta-D-mannuronate) lyase
VIGEDHIVRGNYFEDLTGDDARSTICLMMGVPNSPANRYFQVKRAQITGNMIVNSEHPILIGLEDDKTATLAPVDTVFEGNMIFAPKYPSVEARCDLSGVTWKGNVFAGASLGIPATPGIETDEPKITPLKAIVRTEVGTTW